VLGYSLGGTQGTAVKPCFCINAKGTKARVVEKSCDCRHAQARKAGKRRDERVCRESVADLKHGFAELRGESSDFLHLCKKTADEKRNDGSVQGRHFHRVIYHKFLAL
jgi:hypothetical protein